MNKQVSSWKHQGMISDDWVAVYERYINATICEQCECKLYPTSYHKDGKIRFLGNKRLDHCHETGTIRNVICHSCNVKRGRIDAEVYERKIEERYFTQ